MHKTINQKAITRKEAQTLRESLLMFNAHTSLISLLLFTSQNYQQMPLKFLLCVTQIQSFPFIDTEPLELASPDDNSGLLPCFRRNKQIATYLQK